MAEAHLLVLSVKSSAADTCPFDVAAVTVDAPLCRLVLARHTQVASIFRCHPTLGLYGAEFWDDHCSWLGEPDDPYTQVYPPSTASAEEEEAEEVLQELRQAVEPSMTEYVLMGDKSHSDLPHTIQHDCQCACMVVTADGIHWNALPKNESYQVETATVPVERFSALLRQLESRCAVVTCEPNKEKGA